MSEYKRLHYILFGLLIGIGLIGIAGMMQNEDWASLVIGICSIVGAVVTLDVTENEEEDEEKT